MTCGSTPNSPLSRWLDAVRGWGIPRVRGWRLGGRARRTAPGERAASGAGKTHGGNGYSDEYPVGRFYRNCKAAVIYEGTREIHKLMQADYALGYRQAQTPAGG